MKLPQLSLRDLFWLVALVAMGCGWWVERSRLKTVQEEAAKWKGDAERLAKFVRTLPPTGANYDPSLIPLIVPSLQMPPEAP